VRAAIYTRISEDTEGLGQGVARQEADCQALCEAKGWSVVGVYEDNDRSAFSGKPRPEYERMLDDVKGGALDVIVCWHPDRLHRSPLELEHFIELLEVTGVTVATVTAGDRDFATPDGRFMARIEGTIARRESEHKSARIKRKHKQLAEEGTFVAGRHRPFGYQWETKPGGKRGGLKVVPGEKRLVVEAARRVLAGESLYAITHDWNDRKVPTVTGVQWSTRVLRQILVSGRIAGWRDHHGEPVTKSDQWTPLVDEDTWKALRAILLDPARKRTRVARSYLLGQGLLRCGVCGGQLVATPERRAGGELRPRYGCRKEKGGCGKVSVSAEPVEKIISDAVVQALCDPAFLKRLGGGSGPAEEEQRQAVAECEASLEELSKDFYVDKMITRAEFVAARDVLVPRLDAARAELAKITKHQPSALLRGLDDLQAQWKTLGLDRRRALIELCIESVTIASAHGRSRAGYFDASRVQYPVWRV
jgi:DNA invertase Pin-like site-specific DNA recombinase